MPLLIIAGMPTALMSRNRNYIPYIDDWDIYMIPSRDKKKPDLRSCWKKVLKEASKVTEGSHVFAYHHREDEYPKFNHMMKDRHRLLWMTRKSLKFFGSTKYTEMIKQYLNFERQWRDMLRPRGFDAPGLLPECSFSPKRYDDMWSRIRSIHLNKDDMERVFALIRRFRQTHYNNGYWVDSRGLQFTVASEFHGSNPPYGSFKFTFKLPEGFHYDVRGTSPNRDFTIRDVQGQYHRFHKYTNVDCHGSIRGGR